MSTERDIAAAALRWYEAKGRRLLAAKHGDVIDPSEACVARAAARVKEARRIEHDFLRRLSGACDAHVAQLDLTEVERVGNSSILLPREDSNSLYEKSSSLQGNAPKDAPKKFFLSRFLMIWPSRK